MVNKCSADLELTHLNEQVFDSALEKAMRFINIQVERGPFVLWSVASADGGQMQQSNEKTAKKVPNGAY
jgi:hypothetical protein